MTDSIDHNRRHLLRGAATTPVPAHGESQSLDLTLPPLATIMLRAEG